MYNVKICLLRKSRACLRVRTSLDPPRCERVQGQVSGLELSTFGGSRNPRYTPRLGISLENGESPQTVSISEPEPRRCGRGAGVLPWHRGGPVRPLGEGQPRHCAHLQAPGHSAAPTPAQARTLLTFTKRFYEASAVTTSRGIILVLPRPPRPHAGAARPGFDVNCERFHFCFYAFGINISCTS